MGFAPMILHAASHSAVRMLAASASDFPGMPRSPRVRYTTVTAAPRAEYKDSVPPLPDSGSSGCPPTQTTLRRAAADASCGDRSGALEASNAPLRKVRRVRSGLVMGGADKHASSA